MRSRAIFVFAGCLCIVAARGADGEAQDKMSSAGSPGGAIPPAFLPPTPHCDSYSIQTLPSLDFEQRACIWASKLFTPTAVFGSSFMAMIAQTKNDPIEWGQGAKAYGERFGTRYTQGMVKTTATFLAGIVSREDPRPTPPPGYDCQWQSNAVRVRIGRSIARVFFSYRPNRDGSCSVRPAPARTIGALASGFVQLAWLPDRQKTVGNVARSSASGLGLYLSDSVFAEFQGTLWGTIGKVFTTGKSNKRTVGP